MAFKRRVVLGMLAAGAAGLAVMACFMRLTPGNPPPPASEIAELAPPAPQLSTENLVFQRGDTLEDLLRRAGLDVAIRVQAVAAVRAAFDVKKFRAGSNLVLTRSETGSMEGLEYIVDPDHSLQLSRDGEEFQASIADVPGTILSTSVCGTVEGRCSRALSGLASAPN